MEALVMNTKILSKACGCWLKKKHTQHFRSNKGVTLETNELIYSLAIP